MQKWMLLCLLLSGCSPKVPKEYTPLHASASTFVLDKAEEEVYKASIDAYGNSFGGVLMIKAYGADSSRIAMTTEFGNRIFDFSYLPKFRKNYIIEPLDKKLLINILKRDMEGFVRPSYAISEVFEGNTDSLMICNEKPYRYFLRVRNGELMSIDRFKNKKHQVTYTFSPEENTILHLRMPLKISLKKISSDE